MYLTNIGTVQANFFSLALFLLAGFTDYLDGYIARKTNTESGLGALENSMNAGIELMSRIIGKEFVKSKWLVEDNAVLEATRRIRSNLSYRFTTSTK